jgi:hypothetical protein
MEIISVFAILVCFGVYLTERLLLGKRQSVAIRADVETQLRGVQEQLDNQRERLNRIEARR